LIKKQNKNFLIFHLFSEDNIQIITEISENATKEYAIERILQNINQIWNDQKFETTLHKPNVFKIKYEIIDFEGRNADPHPNGFKW